MKRLVGKEEQKSHKLISKVSEEDLRHVFNRKPQEIKQHHLIAVFILEGNVLHAGHISRKALADASR